MITPRGRKRKGDRFERAVVAVMQSHGIDARRVPLSGAAEGWKGDIWAEGPAGQLVLECKMRAAGQKTIRDWLADNDILVLGADRQAPLAVMRLNDLCDLLAEALGVNPIGDGEQDGRPLDEAIHV